MRNFEHESDRHVLKYALRKYFVRIQAVFCRVKRPFWGDCVRLPVERSLRPCENFEDEKSRPFRDALGCIGELFEKFVARLTGFEILRIAVSYAP